LDLTQVLNQQRTGEKMARATPEDLKLNDILAHANTGRTTAGDGEEPSPSPFAAIVRLFEAAFDRIEKLEQQVGDRASGRVKAEPATAPKAIRFVRDNQGRVVAAELR
jgi:hypothetical protein